MTTYISITQIIIAVLIITLVLLQQRGTGLGSAFGGGDGGGGAYSTRRGMQQKFYWATIALGVVFVGIAMLQLFI